MIETGKPVSLEELNSAFSGPAYLANRFYVSVGPHGLRIAFSEQGTPEQLPVYRTAVVMPIQDGISLYRLIRDLLKEPEQALEQVISAVSSTQTPTHG